MAHPADPAQTRDAPGGRTWLGRRAWRRGAVLAGCLLAVAAGAWAWWCQGGLAEGRRLARHGLWPEAHAAAARYLILHPRDAGANLLCAEALSKDEAIPIEVRVPDALKRLGAVPDTAPEAAEARKAEARVLLFLWRDAFSAERAVKRALAIDPGDVEAHFLAWKLLNLTRRHEDAEPHFLAVLEGTPPAERAGVLRDWYFSQFYPVTSTTDLDGLMGFRATPADKATEVESRRLFGFRGADPQSPLANAAMARWFEAEEADLPFALELLDGALAARPDEARAEPFFMETLVDVLVDLGEMERAGSEFDAWQPAETPRAYWLARARVEDEVRNDPVSAATSYERALGEWPGEIDWRTMNRAASCHARAGAAERAGELRARGAELERLFDEKIQSRLRMALVKLDNPEALREVADFYRKIGRPREAAEWDRFIESLGERQPVASGDATAAGTVRPRR